MTSTRPSPRWTWWATPSWAPPTPRPGAPRRAFDLPARPAMRELCGRDAGPLADGAERLGWAETETDWHRLVERADVDLVDICTPGDTHADIAIAALAGRQARALREAARQLGRRGRAMTPRRQAAQQGVRAMVGFTYRRVPGDRARASNWSPRAGSATIHHVRAQYLQDWIIDPEFPLSWRLDKDKAGSGALGDLGAHIVDLARHITGQPITEVSGQLETFVKERPVATRARGLSARPAAPRRAGHRRRRRGLHRPLHRWRPSVSSRRRGSRPVTRTRSGSRSTAPPAAWPSTSSGMNVLEFFDARRARRDAGSGASSSPTPPPLRRRLVAARPRSGLRAQLHPPGRRPGLPPSPRTAGRYRRSPTAPGDGYSPPWRPAADTRTWRGVRLEPPTHPLAAEDQTLVRLLDRRLAGIDIISPASRDLLDPVEATYQLAELGAYAVTFHDDDLLPDDAPARRRHSTGSGRRSPTPGWWWRWSGPNSFCDRSSRRGRSRPATGRCAATRWPRCWVTSTSRPRSARRRS